jgi:hypothetical protein
MEPIKDLGELQPILTGLEAKGLIVYLTPPGRGSLVTHTLYLDREMEKVRREAAGLQSTELAEDPREQPTAPQATAPQTSRSEPRGPSAAIQRSDPSHAANAAGLADDVRRLREEVAGLKREFASAHAQWEAVTQELRTQLAELNRQLGN